ncbi:MAG: RagB/SusD family nutrient uptake outer membrane protein [Cyclobacteriaceae bacterium]|nr:RagB/SusD family nutrient uptake outer membrane protein [Cyclobacteriaceae bacterium]
MKKLKYILIAFALLLFTNSCNLEIQPSDKLTNGKLLTDKDGLEVATSGNYSLLKDVLEFGGQVNLNNSYVRHLYQLSEFAGDNVMYTQYSSDPLYLVFTRNHVPTQENTAYFWFVAYKLILGANLVIESSEEGVSTINDQLIGENYFLRAMAQFDLLKFYSFPYTLGTSNPGIVLRLNATEPQSKARATVGECYDQIISDLEKAISLMDQDRGVEYASKAAAQALLSRVYLYMENNQKTIDYATEVINNSGKRLATRSEYIDNFANTQNSPESLFIIRHISPQDYSGKEGSIGSMYYDDGNNGGWGEVFVSQTFLNLITQHPNDVRNDLILIPGTMKSGYPVRYILKFTGQDGLVNLSSPQYLRLSEMYLNRAEANAKLGNDQLALDDVNIIRTRAGLTGAELYTLGNLGGRSVLDIVLEERRLEMAYEGQRSFDQFRNKRDMNRSYPGIHLASGETTQIIPYDDPANIFYIPPGELTYNPLCTQND